MTDAVSAGSSTPIATAMLGSLFDYAGLFPPAALPMAAAARQYDEYRTCRHSWMLGKFVLPVSRLEEFADAARPLVDSSGDLWPLSLLTPDRQLDWAKVSRFTETHQGKFEIKSFETRNDNGLADGSSIGIDTYVELPLAGPLSPRVKLLESSRLFAKIRTGGLEPEAFPSAAQVAEFLAAAARHNVPCKATAGLHHALPSTRGTHDVDGAQDVFMHGFVNVILANVFIHKNGGISETVDLLCEQNADAFHFEGNQVTWRNHVFRTTEVNDSRRTMFHSIGSCSFREPVSDLQQLGWL